MFSKKTRYALMALSVLARNYGREHLSIGAIAKSQHISQRYLEGILLRLRNEGIVGSIRGKDGGYYLLKEPASVNLLSIVLLFEDSIAFVSCLDDKSDERQCEFCVEVQMCPIRGVIRKIYLDTVRTLTDSTLTDLCK